MEKYTLEELNKKDIFAVRDLARQYGVTSPTKKNKPELVDIIYKVSNGLMEPPTAPRRGRPRKQEMPTPEPTPVEKEAERPVEVTTERRFEGGYQRQPFKPVYVPADSARAGRNHPPREGYNTTRTFNEAVYADQEREGYLELHPDGYGFLRVKNGEFSDMDAHVRINTIRQYDLRRGDYVKAMCRVIQEGKPASVVTVLSINGVAPEKMGKRPNFDELVPIYPDERIRLELPNMPREYATRCIDLVSPIGKGQRGIIVSPPKAGKTTLLKMIARSIIQNYPDIELKVLLIDERPEEVTDMQRSIKDNGEVIYSTFDQGPEHHTKTAELLIARCKRLVEMGKDVVILLDSLTRLARAYNLTIPPTGRTLSGGIDPGALYSPKRFFGAARNIENGGSLTIIATALVDTGSRMDDVIFEEFKGTGNMEIHLDRKLQEKRVFPAIDLAKSGTRREELLLTQSELEGVWSIRKMLSGTENVEATENLLSMIVKTTTNKEFIEQLKGILAAMQKEGFTWVKGSTKI